MRKLVCQHHLQGLNINRKGYTKMAQRFTVEVIKVKGNINWAIKAVVDNLFWHPRYRGYYDKKDALANLAEWEAYHENALREDIFRAREFNHNFYSAEELGISEL